ncbi:hypothetical protein CAPN010_16960 [Capnocytophaga cynodegmi]|uniref:hypothetical protein n=1 Tax=Capnocytophaga cynodegmi TaxID=28189 RepID=UPI001EE36576|nr:hypothetical protein [Capnocytophaga cynodegmi]GJQ07538.1 hypothetical protein CAPN010_16960 [Capnocytophaga cynodegmi]
MKTYFYLLIVFFPFLAFGQNSDIYVMLPNKFDFQKKNNDYQLNSLTKFLLEKENFQVFFENEAPDNIIENPCNYIKANILNTSGMFFTRLQLVFTDCKGKQVFTSEVGKSREKEFKKAYHEALRSAFSTGNKLTIFKQNYKDENPNPLVTNPKPITENEIKSKDKNISTLYAQPNNLGFQLIDNTPKIVLKIKQTSLSNVYIAEDEHSNQGIFYKTENQYVFEFIKDEKLQQKVFNVKF